MVYKGKYIGLLLTFLAWLLMIAHAIIPHHHHNIEVCLQNHDCTHSTQLVILPTTDDHSENEADPICCNLIQLIVVPKNQGKQDFILLETDFANNNWLFLDTSYLNLPGIYSVRFIKRPSIGIKFNQLLLAGLKAMRGPPSIAECEITT